MGELLAIGADGEWEQGVCFKTGEITACLRANEIWSGEEKLMMRGEGEGKVWTVLGGSQQKPRKI